MCGKVEDEGEGSQEIHEFPSYSQRIFHQQEHQQQYLGVGGGGGGGGTLLIPDPSSVLPWSLPPVFNHNPVHELVANSVVPREHEHHHFLASSTPPPPPPPPYGASLFNRRSASALQFAYDLPSSSDHHLGGFAALYGADHLGNRASSSSFNLQSELGKMSAQEIMDAKALAASKSHSEAERRRRERINTHLARLRSLLPNTTKTDKASLLAEVIQHVKDLKRQTSEIAEAGPVPTESDELTVDGADEDGRFVIRASLCCEDRSDLLPDLIKTLKALRLRTLKAEITTLGGRVRNVLLVTGEDEYSTKTADAHYSITSVQEALKAVMEKTAASDDSSSGSTIKRQRTNVSVLEHRSI
ncbi:hypothetical protein H6P81_003110 [Aristolochia fimbriata]|uniref:BHLH domain-containing protein n=1 Tax=Aristolochia fimbriata TaxID=158543 RepID=A0AAV7FBM4_ARIFI|nr:hypothetical protein H6P81_003110 [Aristolochia fimbriata]